MKGLAETASTHEHLELHLAVVTGQLEAVKFLVEEEHFNPMQRPRRGINAVHIAALNGNLQVLKYFVSLHGSILEWCLIKVI